MPALRRSAARRRGGSRPVKESGSGLLWVGPPKRFYVDFTIVLRKLYRPMPLSGYPSWGTDGIIFLGSACQMTNGALRPDNLPLRRYFCPCTADFSWIGHFQKLPEKYKCSQNVKRGTLRGFFISVFLESDDGQPAAVHGRGADAWCYSRQRLDRRAQRHCHLRGDALYVGAGRHSHGRRL